MSAGFDPERLAVVLHEIRSPVAALSSIADFLSGAARERADRREVVRLAVAACRGIERLVVDAAVASVRFERLDIGRLVSDVVAGARLGGEHVRAEVEPVLPLVDGDPDRIRQALGNLLANALAHSPEGTEVVIRVGALGDVVVVSVVDSGTGIAREDQGRIFERGVRLDAGRPGAGLGLAITRAIADAHRGVLTVESAPGLGSTFSLALPARG